VQHISDDEIKMMPRRRTYLTIVLFSTHTSKNYCHYNVNVEITLPCETVIAVISVT